VSVGGEADHSGWFGATFHTARALVHGSRAADEGS
jgi:hypothetical protein